MNQASLPQNPTGINGVGRARKSIPGTYSTGKGTTARILDTLKATSAQLTAADIGLRLNVPARQLSKRLRELALSKRVNIHVADKPFRYSAIA